MHTRIATTALAISLIPFSMARADECATTRYEVSYKGDDNFEVAVHFTPSSQNVTTFSYEDVSGQLTLDDYFSDVTVSMSDGPGSPLSNVDLGNWRMPEQFVGKEVVLRYRVTAKQDEASWPFGQEEVGHHFDEGFYFVGYSIFLADEANESCDAVVDFDLPSGWGVHAPWTQMTPMRFETASLERLQRNGFTVGPNIGSQTVKIGERSFTFVYEEALKTTAVEAQTAASGLSAHFVDLFGGAPESDYFIFLAADDKPGGGAFADSFGQRFVTPVRPEEKVVWLHGFAHEFIHRWLGHGIRFENETDLEWFQEGVTDYLTIKGLFATGAIDEVELEKKLENSIRRYLLALRFGGPMSFAEAGKEKARNRMMIYGGGAVFSLLLDAELSSQKGPGAFEGFLSELYAGRDTHYSYADILERMNTISDGHAGEILEGLEHGMRASDIASNLSPHDVRLASFMEEVYITFGEAGCARKNPTCVPAFLRNKENSR